MKRNVFLRTAATATLAGLLAAPSALLAQNSPSYPSPAPAADPQPASANPNGGWKRVGDNSQVSNPNVPDDPQAPDPGVNPNEQQPSYPSSNGPDGRSARPAYPSQTNRQGGYGQQNYPPEQQGNPPAPVPSTLTVQPGTYLTVRVNQLLSSDKNQPGDAFTASLVQPLVVNGVVVAEPGQTVGGRVATAEKHHIDKTARLGIQLTNLSLVDGQQIPVTTQFISRQGRKTSGGTEFGTVATTTGVGAAIGAAAGWGTGAAIGAGAGAAAGLIGVLVTHNHASVIYPEQVLTFRIETPVTISTANSSQAFRYVAPNEYDRPVYTNGSPQGPYESAAPPPAYNYPDPYYYGYGYGYGYPYWGPSFGFYGGGYWLGGLWYPGRYYRGGYYGGRGYYGGGRGYYGGRSYSGGRGYVGGYRAGIGGAYRGSVSSGYHGGVSGHVSSGSSGHSGGHR